MKKKWFSLLLAAALPLSVLPMLALGTGADDIALASDLFSFDTSGGGEFVLSSDDYSVDPIIIDPIIVDPIIIDPYSKGLKFTSNGDGTCHVSGIGTCTDTALSIPPTSPAGDTVTSISSYSFQSCPNLTSVVLPSTVTQIVEGAFKGCTNLTSISLPANLTFLGEDAFAGCFRLKSITLPAGLVFIDKGVFYHCTSLTSITLPATLTSITGGAFCECNALTDVYYLGSSEKRDKALTIISDFNDCLLSASWHYTEPLAGDVTLDRKVTSADLTLLAKHVGRLYNLTDVDALTSADLDQNDTLDAADLTALAKQIGGIQ